MTSTPSPAPPRSPVPPVAPAPSLASAPPLARRLTRRAIDLLVVAFLVAVGLSTGQQLIDWWRVDPSAVAPELPELNGVELDWSRSPVTLQFGNASTSIERIPFQGSRRQMEDELTRIGQAIVTSTDAAASPMDDAEKGWLAALNSAPPVFWDSTRGNVYRRHEPLPSFVATRFTDSGSDAEPAAESGGQRIVGWGLAFPSGPVEWTIYVFHPDSAKSVQAEPPRPIAFPAGSRNITHVRGANGCEWYVIQGRGDLSGWVQHFDNQLGTESLVARVVGAGTASLKYRRERIVTDVQIRSEPDGRLTGVIWSAVEREPR